MSITLDVHEGEGRSWRFEAEQQVRIGRDPARASLVLSNAYVSRLQCVIQRRINGQWVLIHRGRNPSRIDGRELRQPGEQTVVLPGSTLILAGIHVQIELNEDPSVAGLEFEEVIEGEEDEEWMVAGDDEAPGLDMETLLDEQIPSVAQLKETLEEGHERSEEDPPRRFGVQEAHGRRNAVRPAELPFEEPPSSNDGNGQDWDDEWLTEVLGEIDDAEAAPDVESSSVRSSGGESPLVSPTLGDDGPPPSAAPHARADGETEGGRFHVSSHGGSDGVRHALASAPRALPADDTLESVRIDSILQQLQCSARGRRAARPVGGAESSAASSLASMNGSRNLAFDSSASLSLDDVKSTPSSTHDPQERDPPLPVRSTSLQAGQGFWRGLWSRFRSWFTWRS